MRFLRSILLAILVSLTTWLGGCDDDDDQAAEEPPVVRAVAGEATGEESSAGEELPLDLDVSSAGETAGDQDVSGGDSSVEEDCDSEGEEVEEDCVEPESSEEGLPQS